MARIRSVYPAQWTDGEFIECSPLARLLILGLRNEADDQGVFQWLPKQLKARILPADDCDIEALLEEAAGNNQIQRYEVDGKAYGAIRNFGQYNRPDKPSARYPILRELVPYVQLEGATFLLVIDDRRRPGRPKSGAVKARRASDAGATTRHGYPHAVHDNGRKLPENGPETRVVALHKTLELNKKPVAYRSPTGRRQDRTRTLKRKGQASQLRAGAREGSAPPGAAGSLAFSQKELFNPKPTNQPEPAEQPLWGEAWEPEDDERGLVSALECILGRAKGREAAYRLIYRTNIGMEHSCLDPASCPRVAKMLENVRNASCPPAYVAKILSEHALDAAAA